MKTKSPRREPLTFGELIAITYSAVPKSKLARDIVVGMVNSHAVRFKNHLLVKVV
jgi:hypothetical protein